MLAPILRDLSRRRDFEFRIIGNFDIGVYRLPVESLVGKSSLKAIVYMAMGLPIVASAVGTTPLRYEHGDIGFMVRNDEEWLDALTRLIDSEDERLIKGAMHCGLR